MQWLFHGYNRNNDTYVPSHYRTFPGSNFNNNGSTRDNYIPFTSEPGYRAQPSYSNYSSHSH